MASQSRVSLGTVLGHLGQLSNFWKTEGAIDGADSSMQEGEGEKVSKIKSRLKGEEEKNVY